jgi:predicted lysophospholipase L1 biosynthesis ABC-type transport system permease subunit
MKIPLHDGRDFRPDETTPGAAIVNETFARQFFAGESVVGKTFARGRYRYQVVGLVPDSPYRSLHEPILPVAYTPFRGPAEINHAALMVRTVGQNPLVLASRLRREVPRARAEFRVSDISTQAELVRAQTLRERMLAMLALFFAGVAVLLAGIGLYGVLDYSVLQRRREIGIRMAIGAQAGDIARRVTADGLAMVGVGAAAGLAIGVGYAAGYLQTLLYQVKATEASMLIAPAIVILVVGAVASAPAAWRAAGIDPAGTLRSE